MTPRIATLLFAALTATALAAADTHLVAVRIDPPQEVTAIVVRSGEATQAVSVRNGVIQVPKDLPFPWSLGMTRFEAAPYTREDLELKRPWVIRELGALAGSVERPSPKAGEPFVWLLQNSDSDAVLEREFVVGANGAFRVSLPAGTYHGAIVGTSSATRVRSAIIIKPGQTTDTGTLTATPTTPVSLRVVDAKTRKPVAGARVAWDPPGDMLNTSVIRALYARRWSAVTNRSGIAEFSSIGPIPHSVRWKIESSDYAPAQTQRLRLRELKRVVLPDVALRQEPSVLVRVQFPRRDEEGLANCTLVGGELRDPQSPIYEPVVRRPLKEGETRLDFTSYGRKRLSIADKRGATIFWHDFEVTEEQTVVDLRLRPVEVHGRVTQREKGVPGMLVRAGEPHDTRVVLALVTSDEQGNFRFTTWQRGEMSVYTISPRAGAGRAFGRGRASVTAGDRDDVEVDLAIPANGFVIKVVDAQTGAPVKARVGYRGRFDAGGGTYGGNDTDANGVLEVSGYPRGKANLHVTAKRYRSVDVDIDIRPESPEATVRLERGKPLVGRVVNVLGQPVAGARIVGGFRDDFDDDGYHRTTTDRNGRFEFDGTADPATTFYVLAPGHALTVASLRDDQPTTVVLHPPSLAGVSLRDGNKPPENVFLVNAAALGHEIIPLGVLGEFAELSGMDLYQLCGSSIEGDVILPQFLAPGTYDLFLARRGGEPFTYQRIGAVTTPLPRNRLLVTREK